MGDGLSVPFIVSWKPLKGDMRDLRLLDEGKAAKKSLLTPHYESSNNLQCRGIF